MLKKGMKGLKRTWAAPPKGSKAAIAFALRMHFEGDHPTAYTLYWLYREDQIETFKEDGNWLIKRVPQDETMTDDA